MTAEKKPKLILYNSLDFTIYVDIRIINNCGRRLKFTLFRDKNLGINPLELKTDEYVPIYNAPFTKHNDGGTELLYNFEMRFYTNENIAMQTGTNEFGDTVFRIEPVTN